MLEAIEHHGGHLTAERIYTLVKRQFPRLSLGTVYRNLRVLIAQGNVRELDFGGGFSHFEIAKDAHYHFICRVCGQVEDADVPIRQRLTASVERSARAMSFRIEDHRLDFVGVCEVCQRVERRTSQRAKY